MNKNVSCSRINVLIFAAATASIGVVALGCIMGLVFTRATVSLRSVSVNKMNTVQNAIDNASVALARLPESATSPQVFLKILEEFLNAGESQKRDQPSANLEYYKPLESPRMYPLELDERLHINLWSEDGQHKWTIAMWVSDGECSELRFLHDRPFDPRVNWRDFEAIIRQGQRLADKRYEDSKN